MAGHGHLKPKRELRVEEVTVTSRGRRVGCLLHEWTSPEVGEPDLPIAVRIDQNIEHHIEFIANVASCAAGRVAAIGYASGVIKGIAS